MVAAHAAQPAPFRRPFFIKVKFPDDVEKCFIIVNPDFNAAGCEKITGNALADTAKADDKVAFSLTKQVWLMGKQFRVIGDPLQKELLLIEASLDYSGTHF